MKKLDELNLKIDKTLYEPHFLPVYEYILMPNIGSDDLENFRKKYIQNYGKNLEEFKNKLEPFPIYAVFKNKNNNPLFLFEPENKIKPVNPQISKENICNLTINKDNY